MTDINKLNKPIIWSLIGGLIVSSCVVNKKLTFSIEMQCEITFSIKILFFYQIGYLVFDKFSSSNEDKPSEAAADDNIQSELDSMKLNELYTYAVENPEHRDMIIKKYLVGKFGMHRLQFVAISDTKMIPSLVHENVGTGIFILDGNSAPLIEFGGEVLQHFKLVCTGFEPLVLQQIIQTLNKHSSQSLRSLIFEDCAADAINEFKEKFAGVNGIAFLAGKFEHNDECPNFNEVFPNVKTMDLEFSDNVNTKCLEQNFAKLEHLEFFGSISNKIGDFSEIFRLNGHLKSIAVWSEFDENFLSSMSQLLPEIQILRFHVQDMKFFTPDTYQPAHFKNVKILRIATDFDCHHEPQKLPFTFDALEALELTRFDITDQWIDIVTENKGLKYLDILGGVLSNKQLFKIARELPGLLGIKAIWNRENANGFLYLMENNKNLLAVAFTNIDTQNQRIARRSYGMNWIIQKVAGTSDIFFARLEEQAEETKAEGTKE